MKGKKVKKSMKNSIIKKIMSNKETKDEKNGLKKETINVAVEPYVDYGTIDNPKFDWLNFFSLSEKDMTEVDNWIDKALRHSDDINFNISGYALWQDCKMDTGVNLTYEQFEDAMMFKERFKREIVANPYFNPRYDNGVKHYEISYYSISNLSSVFHGAWKYKKVG